MLESLQEEHDVNNKASPPLNRFFHLGNLEGYSYIDYHRDLCKLTNLPVNEDHFQKLIRGDQTVWALFNEGKGWEIKLIDWNLVFGDYDYATTSDTF